VDLSKSIIYRRFDFNSIAELQPNQPMNGFVVNEVKLLPVEGWGYKEKRSLADGYDASDVYLGIRLIQMRGTIYAVSKLRLHDQIRLLRAACTPTNAFAESQAQKGYMPLTFTMPTADANEWPTGEIPMMSLVRPTEQPGVLFIRETAFGKQDGYSSFYEVQFEAKDPLFYHQEPQVFDLSGVESGIGQFINRGDYATQIDFQLHVPSSQPQPKAIVFTGGGTRMTVTVPGANEDRVVRVDSRQKIAVLDIGTQQTLRMDLVVFDAENTWPRCRPGVTNYDWQVVGGPMGSGSRMSWREAFV
jgi:hypothetical protein